MNKRVCLLLICLSGSLCGQAQTGSAVPAWAGRYEAVRPSENVFIVTRSGKMGVVSRQGNLLTQLAYDTIFNFREGMAIVGRGHRVVNQFGKVSADFKYGYLAKAGRLVVPMQYEHIEGFSEGLGYVLPSLHADYWFNKNGQIAISLGNLVHGTSFQGNMAYVEVAHLHIGFKLTNNYDRTHNPFDVRGNYIDHAGRLLVPWKYDTIAPYQPGYLRPVRKNGKWGFLDSLARVAVPLHYDDIDTDSTFFWQTLRRVGLAGRFGFMNSKTGQLVIPLHYQATLPSQRPVLWVRLDNLWGIIDPNQRIVMPPRYDDVTPFDKQGVAVVKRGNLYGLVNEHGQELTPIQYERIWPFQEARAVVKRDGRFGFVTTNGRESIPVVYDEVSPFNGGRAFAKRWGLFVTLDPDGNWIGWKLQTLTLQCLLALLVLLTGLSGWVRHRHKVKAAFPDG